MIAFQKPQTIGPAISRHTRVLPGRDFGRSGSVYRAMSRSAWTAAVDRRFQEHARPTHTVTATQCKLAHAIAGDSALQNQAKNQRIHCPLTLWTYSPPQALTKNHNVVQSFSPGLAAQRPTPGKSHKIQPLIFRECGPREARIKIAANFPKIQHCFPHPQTNPHPKSTVDLGCEWSIRVENGLRPPLFPSSYHAFRLTTTRESRGANETKAVTHQKIYPASRLIQVETRALEFRNFSGAWRLALGAFAKVAVRKNHFAKRTQLAN